MALNSPTKDIRQGLEGLSINNVHNKENLHSKGTKRELHYTKRPLQPSLVQNIKFVEADDSSSISAASGSAEVKLNQEFCDDTVIHNENVIATPPDYMKFKQPKSSNISDNSHRFTSVPSLTRSATTAATITHGMRPVLCNDPGDEDEYSNFYITDTSAYPEIDNTRVRNMNITDIFNKEGHPNEKHGFDNTGLPEIDISQLHRDLSFLSDSTDDLNGPIPANSNDKKAKIKPSSHQMSFIAENFQSISNNEQIPTYKATSFSPHKPVVSSPLPTPKFKGHTHSLLGKPKLTEGQKESHPSSICSPKETSQPLHNTNSPQYINMITPIAEEMVFDKQEDKWKHLDPRNNLDLRDMDNLTLRLGQSGPRMTSPLPVSQSTMKPDYDSTKEVLENITLYQNMDISYSQIKSSLAQLLQSRIEPKVNWKAISELDLSEEGVDSVKGLSAVLPFLKTVNLDGNKLTSLDGLSSSLLDLSLSRNGLKDKAMAFNKKEFQLQSLDLSCNDISSLLEFQSLRNLKQLFLSGNNIHTLRSLHNVEILDLSNNDLSGDLDFGEVSFETLKRLNLSGNRITRIKGLNLRDLEELDISRNPGLVKIEHSNSFKNLLRINLFGCSNIKSLDVNIFPRLLALSVDGTVELKGQLNRLLDLQVQNSNGSKWLTENKNLSISNGLQGLTMKNCSLKTVREIRNLYRLFPNLKKLDLEDNDIDGSFGELYETLSKFKALVIIEMNGNTIREKLRTIGKEIVTFDYLMQRVINHEYGQNIL